MRSSQTRLPRAVAALSISSVALIPFQTYAQTVVDGETNGPVRTSEVGDVEVTEDGVITADSGPAVIVDSSSDVFNEGEIAAGEDDGATGIRIQSGTSGSIINDGDIEVLEDFTGEDGDQNGVADGAIARASDRYGIYVEPGGIFNGRIENNGDILVDGLSSGGVVVDSRLTGDLLHGPDGGIEIIGDNSIGIGTQDVAGNIEIRGDITVIGRASSAMVSDGDVGGTITLQGSIAQRTSFVTDDDTSLSLSRDDLRAGAPAVAIRGNVDGGITVAAPPEDADGEISGDDTDGDGIDDNEEGTGSIVGFGAAPALEIEGADPIIIGASTTGYALQVDGTINGNGSSRTIDAVGVSVGGDGGVVDLDGGIGVTGRVSATTFDSVATGILIGENSRVPELNIGEGGVVNSSISSTGDGESYAVRDLSGTLTSVRSNGFITANGSFEDVTVALDLSANTSGVTIIQFSPPDEDEDEEELITTAITGDILTGSGDDLLDVSDGQIRGDSFFDSGDDRVVLSGDAIYSGDIDFGEGLATLDITDDATMSGAIEFNDQIGAITIAGDGAFRGQIGGGDALSVDVQSGSFGAEGADVIAFDTLNVGADGSLVVFVDTDTGENSLFDVGTANFADGATIGAEISSLEFEEGTYLVLVGDEIGGSPEYDTESTDLPFLFEGDVFTDTAAGEITLQIQRKSAVDLGLDPALDGALTAILDAAGGDTAIENSLLEADDEESLQTQILGLTPEYSGGNFDLATSSSRLAAAHLYDHETMFSVSDTRIWVESYYLNGDYDPDSIAGGYSLGSFGLTGGYEAGTPFGRVGLSANISWGSNSNGAVDAEVDASQYEAALHWREQLGDLLLFARGSFAYIGYSSERTFEGDLDGTTDDNDEEDDEAGLLRLASGDFDGFLYSGLIGASYQTKLGERFTLTPRTTLEYFRLDEDGYEESGGGDGMNLIVEDRSSDSLSINSTLALAYSIGPQQPDMIPMSIEIEAGRRTVLNGSLGDTIAEFEDVGDSFRLVAPDIESAWLGEISLNGGGYDYFWSVNAVAEHEGDRTIYSLRAGLGIAF